MPVCPAGTLLLRSSFASCIGALFAWPVAVMVTVAERVGTVGAVSMSFHMHRGSVVMLCLFMGCSRWDPARVSDSSVGIATGLVCFRAAGAGTGSAVCGSWLNLRISRVGGVWRGSLVFGAWLSRGLAMVVVSCGVGMGSSVVSLSGLRVVVWPSFG